MLIVFIITLGFIWLSSCLALLLLAKDNQSAILKVKDALTSTKIKFYVVVGIVSLIPILNTIIVWNSLKRHSLS